MVVIGCFSAQLVDASTKLPFREHVGPHGQCYVETEPDAEYFIQIQVMFGETVDTEYNVMYFVDGQDLGFYTQISEEDGPHLVGLCSRENGVTIKKAIRCVSPTKTTNNTASSTTQPTANNQLSPPVPMMGMVTVKFSQAICTGKVKKRQRNYNASQALADGDNKMPQNHTTTGALKKKMLRSAEGSASVTSSERGLKKFKPGLLLQEINLHYCTALGLIYACVLEKPPLWDMHSKNDNKVGKVKREQEDAAIVPQHSCKRVKVDAVFDDGGIMLAAPKEYNVIEFLDDYDDVGLGTAAAMKQEEESPTEVTSTAQFSVGLKEEGNDDDDIGMLPTAAAVKEEEEEESPTEVTSTTQFSIGLKEEGNDDDFGMLSTAAAVKQEKRN